MSALRPDASTFNRLLVWVGLALSIGALVVPWLFYRDVGVLSLRASEIKSLTPLAQTEVHNRQESLRRIDGYIGYTPTLIPIGLMLVVWGAFGLRRTQRTEETKLVTEIEKMRREFVVEPQSPAERDEKLAAEGASSVAELVQAEESVRSGEEIEPTPRSPQPEAPDAPEQREPQRASVSTRDRIAEIRDVEERTLDAIADLGPPGYSFQRRVKVSGPNSLGSILLDGVYQAADPATQPDVLVEIKLARSGLIVPQYRDQAIALAVRYINLTGRRAIAWLIVIAPNANDGDLDRFRRQFRTNEIDQGPLDFWRAELVTSPASITRFPTLDRKGG